MCKAHSLCLGDTYLIQWGGVSDWQPRNLLTMWVLKCLCSRGVCSQRKPMCVGYKAHWCSYPAPAMQDGVPERTSSDTQERVSCIRCATTSLTV